MSVTMIAIYYSYMKFYLFFAFLTSFLAYGFADKAVVIVPVADLLKKSARELFPACSVEQAYAQLPLGDTFCKREYQALFNEVVDVMQEVAGEVQIRLPHIIYFDKERGCYDNSYWTLRSNVIRIDELIERGVERALVPPPISSPLYKWHHAQYRVVTLTMPYTQPAGRHYSAGTRFMALVHTLHDDFIECHTIDQQCNHVVLMLPANICMWNYNTSLRERRSAFVALLKQWAHLQSGFIPYVYSGSSFIEPYYNDTCILTVSTMGEPLFTRPAIQVPAAGLDCSCLISRAAQICGLPYFYKDSTTIERNLVPVKSLEQLQEGDVIWFPGHVMLISDIKNNCIIEARGYEAGFGKVHELPLQNIFKDICTFEQLMAAYVQHRPLTLLASNGSIRYTISRYKILSLASALYGQFRALQSVSTVLVLGNADASAAIICSTPSTVNPSIVAAD